MDRIQGQGAKSDDIDLESAYYSDHDLRATFTRDEVGRRRTGGATLRRYLDDKQDKQCLNRMVKIRAAYDVSCNDDVVIVFAQQLMEEGKGEGLDPRLVKIAEETSIPERQGQPEAEAEAV